MLKVLLVEDEKPTRMGIRKNLDKAGWDVMEAENGQQALEILKTNYAPDIMLLDQRMPVMNGNTLLIETQKGSYDISCIILLSAFIESSSYAEVLEYGIRGIIHKPVKPESLPVLLLGIYQKSEEILNNIPTIVCNELFMDTYHCGNEKLFIFSRNNNKALSDEQSEKFSKQYINKTIAKREKAIKEYFKNVNQMKIPFELPDDDPLLIVARRWNSWYPSFFNTEGGSYAVLAKTGGHNTINGSLIDPGFKAISVLNSMGIPLSCLGTCIITHNHPDHMGGIFEYLTTRYVLEPQNPPTIFCARAVHEVLKTLAGKSLDIKQFDTDTHDLISAPGPDQILQKLKATPFRTSHYNTGQEEGSRGIKIDTEIKRGDDYINTTGVILGDTDYNCKEPPPNVVYGEMRNVIFNTKLKLMVLHIGCSQLKEATGKHLYLPGLIMILKDVDNYRRQHMEHPESNKLLVLISEWGLEHADIEQVQKVLHGKPAAEIEEAFDTENLILTTIEFLREKLDLTTLTLLPADIGLMAGLVSGKIYLKGRDPKNPRSLTMVDPDKIKIGKDKDGLTYVEKK